MKNEKHDFLVVTIWGILLSYLTYLFVMNELTQTLSDFRGHTYVYLPMFYQGRWLEGWMTVPYCMWHLTTLFLYRVLLIPLENAAAYTTCLFTMFAYYVTYWVIQKITAAAGKMDSSLRAGAISFGLCIVQAFYFHWLDAGDRFLGSYSMNPLHNPTYMCVRPFSIICFCLIYDIWGAQKNTSYQGLFFHVEKGLKKYYIYLAILLLLSAIAKPTFAEMFIPAVAFIMLGKLISRLLKKEDSAIPYFKHCLTTLLCAVPTLLYILTQFLDYYILGGRTGESESIIITKWLEVWHMYSENIGLSILLGMAFPLYMLLIDAKYFFKSDMGRLSLVGYLIGFLEAAVLGESGNKLGHANFLWPMMSGMLFMFLTALLRLIVLERTQSETKLQKLLIAIGWFLFCIHVLYGFMYIKSML